MGNGGKFNYLRMSHLHTLALHQEQRIGVFQVFLHHLQGKMGTLFTILIKLLLF